MREDRGISEEGLSKLIRGERPEGMSYDEFKIKRKAGQLFIKNKLKYGREV